jgi:hypothetical protein
MIGIQQLLGYVQKGRRNRCAVKRELGTVSSLFLGVGGITSARSQLGEVLRGKSRQFLRLRTTLEVRQKLAIVSNTITPLMLKGLEIVGLTTSVVGKAIVLGGLVLSVWQVLKLISRMGAKLDGQDFIRGWDRRANDQNGLVVGETQTQNGYSSQLVDKNIFNWCGSSILRIIQRGVGMGPSPVNESYFVDLVAWGMNRQVNSALRHQLRTRLNRGYWKQFRRTLENLAIYRETLNSAFIYLGRLNRQFQ